MGKILPGFVSGRLPTLGPALASLSHIDSSPRGGQHLNDASVAPIYSASSRFCAQPYTPLLGGGGNTRPMTHHQNAIPGSDSAFSTTGGFVSGCLQALGSDDGFIIAIGCALPC